MTNQMIDPTAVALPEGYRLFASASEPNTRWQVAVGDPEHPQNKPIVTMEGLAWNPMRYGDVYAEFQDGLLMTNDPQIIAFCESKFPTIVDMQRADANFLIKMAQLQTATQDYEPTIDVDLLSLASDSIKAAIDAEVARRMSEVAAKVEGTVEGVNQ